MTAPTFAPSLALAFGIWEGALVLAVLLLVFGATKIPQLARGLGAGIRNFKGELRNPDAPPDDQD